MRLVVAVSIVVCLLAPSRVHATGRCYLFDWYTVSGSLSTGAGCGAMLLSTNAAGADHAEGRVVYVANASGRGEHALTLRRLTDDGGSLQIEFPGGYVLLRDGDIGLYINEAQWIREGWRALPATVKARRQVDRRHLIVDLRDERTVVVKLDGIEVGRWPLPSRPPRGTFGVWILGPRGARSRVSISEWSVTAAR